MKVIRPSAGTTSVVAAQSLFLDAACLRYFEDFEARRHGESTWTRVERLVFTQAVRSGQLSWPNELMGRITAKHPWTATSMREAKRLSGRGERDV